MANNSVFSKANNEELRIVMVGKTGIGKSATGNTILGRQCFESKFSPRSMTVDCSKGKATVDGQKVAVIDTPGLFDTRFGMNKTTADLCQCISYAAPGPHVFLVVIRLGRFTEEEKQTVQRIQEIFGQAADKYSMVLFTCGDLLQDMTIEQFLNDSPDLQKLVGRCNGQYHVFNNNNLKDSSQVSELLQKIKNIVRKNGGSHYTNEMFREAEKAIEEKKKQILKEKEDKIRKQEEELEKKHRELYENEIRKMNEQFKAEREREERRRQEERNRDRQLMDEERKKAREEQEAERKREREEKDREMTMTMNRIREAHDKELERERQNLQSRYETKAREKAERSNPLYGLIEAGEAIIQGAKTFFEGLVSVFKR